MSHHYWHRGQCLKFVSNDFLWCDADHLIHYSSIFEKEERRDRSDAIPQDCVWITIDLQLGHFGASLYFCVFRAKPATDSD